MKKTNETPVVHFQEVEVLRNHPVNRDGKTVVTFERIKTLRPKVNISRKQADILNAGPWQHNANMRFSMYLLPTETIPDFVQPVGGGADQGAYYQAVGREPQEF